MIIPHVKGSPELSTVDIDGVIVVRLLQIKAAMKILTKQSM